MRVLQINAVDSIGSTGTIMSDIQDVCTHNGIECHIAYAVSQRHKSEILNGYHIGNWFDHKLHALLWRITRKEAFYSTIPTWFLLRHIRKIHPDVVHLHNLHSHYINLHMLLRYLAKHDIPTVATLHDSWFYTGGCYIPGNCEEWQHGCQTCKMFPTGCHRHLSHQILTQRTQLLNAIPRLTLVGVSDWISNECRKSLLGKNNILTIRNGVRTDVFCPMQDEARRELRAKYGISDSHFVILAPSSKWLNPSNSQGLELILSNLKDDEVLLLYGCSQKQLTSSSTSEKLRLLPFEANKPRLSTLYSLADVMINCTHSDTCSFINIECQACGTPVITFDNTGASETVDNIHSFRVPTDDYQAMADKIAEIKSLTPSNSQTLKPSNSQPLKPLNSQTLKPSNPSSSRDWIHSHFTMRGNYEQYVQLYRHQSQANISSENDA